MADGGRAHEDAGREAGAMLGPSTERARASLDAAAKGCVLLLRVPATFHDRLAGEVEDRLDVAERGGVELGLTVPGHHLRHVLELRPAERVVATTSPPSWATSARPTIPVAPVTRARRPGQLVHCLVIH